MYMALKHLGQIAAALIAAGAVIGERGFGLVAGPGGLEPVPQLASVVLGDNVEVGANSTIDRGALIDTVIGDGVRKIMSRFPKVS